MSIDNSFKAGMADQNSSLFPVLIGPSGLNTQKLAPDPGAQPRRLGFTPGHHLISPSGLKSARWPLLDSPERGVGRKAAAIRVGPLLLLKQQLFILEDVPTLKLVNLNMKALFDFYSLVIPCFIQNI
jgi:hypothetical protein